MNANQLAEMLECLGWRSVDANLREAAEMLRRQHEAIKQLREACQQVFDQWGECQATKKCRKALADTEQFINKGN